jgi:hypothetical protein
MPQAARNHWRRRLLRAVLGRVSATRTVTGKKAGRKWFELERYTTTVVASITAAVLLFILATLFKHRVYDLLTPPIESSEFPLFVTWEGYNTQGKVLIDLFIINKTDQAQTSETLDVEARELSKERGRAVSSGIRLVPTTGVRIDSVITDAAFNDGKGECDVLRRSNGNVWVLTVQRVEPEAVLRYVIVTDSHRPAMRDAKVSLPLEVLYPGGPQE